MTRIMLTLQPRALQNNLGPFRKHLTTLDPSKIPYTTLEPSNNNVTFRKYPTTLGPSETILLQPWTLQKTPYNPGPFRNILQPWTFKSTLRLSENTLYNPGHFKNTCRFKNNILYLHNKHKMSNFDTFHAFFKAKLIFHFRNICFALFSNLIRDKWFEI